MKVIPVNYAMNYVNLQYGNNQGHVNHRQISFLSTYIEQSKVNMHRRFSTTSTSLTNKMKKSK